MKRIITVLAVAAMAAITVQGAHAATPKAAPKSSTYKGEIVDMGCYLAHEAHGEKHKSCATKCVANGMPMGLLTADGKLYLLTVSHDTSDPFNKAKELAGDMVEVTGTVMERAGVKALEVDAVKPAK